MKVKIAGQLYNSAMTKQENSNEFLKSLATNCEIEIVDFRYDFITLRFDSGTYILRSREIVRALAALHGTDFISSTVTR